MPGKEVQQSKQPCPATSSPTASHSSAWCPSMHTHLVHTAWSILCEHGAASAGSMHSWSCWHVPLCAPLPVAVPHPKAPRAPAACPCRHRTLPESPAGMGLLRSIPCGMMDAPAAAPEQLSSFSSRGDKGIEVSPWLPPAFPSAAWLRQDQHWGACSAELIVGGGCDAPAV